MTLHNIHYAQLARDQTRDLEPATPSTRMLNQSLP